jgi:hypothetical protein
MAAVMAPQPALPKADLQILVEVAEALETVVPLPQAAPVWSLFE